MAASSQHPGCYKLPPRLINLTTYLGTLAVGLGYFPFDHGPYHPQPHSRRYLLAFGVCQGLVGGEAPSPISSSTSNFIIRGCPKIFRGEPAISQFDWPFTLSTGHPKAFQQQWFGPPRVCYHTFNLAMDRSPVSRLPH